MLAYNGFAYVSKHMDLDKYLTLLSELTDLIIIMMSISNW